MKNSFTYLLLISFTVISCKETAIIEPAMFAISDAVSETSKTITSDEVSERACIDNLLSKELDAGESIRSLVVNTDVDFCNGVRVRLKTYKFASKKYKVFGYVRSNSGHETCIKESEDYTHTAFIGDKGVLIGNDIKILLGGHQFNSDNKIIPSEHRLARFVKFDWGSYNGEMALMEKGKLRCWAIQ